jgi:hypothetical protein
MFPRRGDGRGDGWTSPPLPLSLGYSHPGKRTAARPAAPCRYSDGALGEITMWADGPNFSFPPLRGDWEILFEPASQHLSPNRPPKLSSHSTLGQLRDHGALFPPCLRFPPFLAPGCGPQSNSRGSQGASPRW